MLREVQQFLLRVTRIFASRIPTRRTALFASGVFVTLIIIMIAVVPEAHAQASYSLDVNTVASAIGITGGLQFFLTLLNGVLSVIVAVLGLISNLLFQILAWSFNWTGVLSVDAVQIGWRIVRDFCNMFFIIVLLIMAFGTILQQEKYHYRQLLPTFVLMAILINFTQVIAGVFIDFSNILMYTFTDSMVNVTGGSLVSTFGMQDFLTLDVSDLSVSIVTITGAYLLAIMFMVLIIGVTVVYFIVFAGRTIGLWLLVILSPLAFLANTVPFGREYWSRWWKEFANYIMVGPLLAFFLWLAVLVGTGTGAEGQEVDYISQATAQGSQSQSVVSDLVGGETETANLLAESIYSPEAIIRFIIAMILMVMGLKFAESMKTVGASVAGKAAGALPGIAAGVSTLGFYQSGRDYFKGVGKGISSRYSSMMKDTESRGEAFGAGVGHTIDQAAQYLTPQTAAARAAKRKRDATYQKSQVDRMAEQGQYANAQMWSNDRLATRMRDGNQYQQIAAMRELAKRGAIDVNNPQHMRSVNTILARTGGELGDEVEDVIRKQAPEVALTTLYTNQDGSRREEALRNDIAAGKISASGIGGALGNDAISGVGEDGTLRSQWGNISAREIAQMIPDRKKQKEFYGSLRPAQKLRLREGASAADFVRRDPQGNVVTTQNANGETVAVVDTQMATNYAFASGNIDIPFTGGTVTDDRGTYEIPVMEENIRTIARADKKEYMDMIKKHPRVLSNPTVLRLSSELLTSKDFKNLSKDGDVREQMNAGMLTHAGPGQPATAGRIVEMNAMPQGTGEGQKFSRQNNKMRQVLIRNTGEVHVAFDGDEEQLRDAYRAGQISPSDLGNVKPSQNQITPEEVAVLAQEVVAYDIWKIDSDEGNRELATAIMQGIQQLAQDGDQGREEVLEAIRRSEWGAGLLQPRR